jgi:hypothetical protein
LLDGPLARLLNDDLSCSIFKDGLHRTLTIDLHFDWDHSSCKRSVKAVFKY